MHLNSRRLFRFSKSKEMYIINLPAVSQNQIASMCWQNGPVFSVILLKLGNHTKKLLETNVLPFSFGFYHNNILRLIVDSCMHSIILYTFISILWLLVGEFWNRCSCIRGTSCLWRS